MNGPRHDHAEWSKPDRKDKYHMIPFIYGILKKKKRYKWTYLQNRNGPIDIENKFMVTMEG